MSLSFIGLSQDTLYVKINDTAELSQNKYKKAPCLEIFFEIISYKKDSFKVQKVSFYEETKIINTTPDYYKILNDSLMLFNNQRIKYFKESDSCYHINLSTQHFKTEGYVKNLIPLIKVGKHNVYNHGNVVLVERYDNNKLIEIEIINITMDDSIYKVVDEPAKFPVKYGKLNDYINNMINSSFQTKESSIQGTVIINATITKEGNIVNPEVLRSVDPMLDMEALRIVSKLPIFIPAKLKRENVNSYLVIPIKFVLK